MSDEEKRRRELIDAMKKERGYMPAPWAYMAEKDIDFIEAYNNLYERSLTEGKALPTKIREFVAMGILAHREQTYAVYEHAKRALRHGATKQEILEAIESIIAPGGAPAFAVGLQALMRIEEDEKKVK